MPRGIYQSGLQQHAQVCAVGGLGFRSATRHYPAAHWASWADAMARVQERHPEVAVVLVRNLSDDIEALSIIGVKECWRILVRAGFELPSWEQLAAGVRPQPHRQGRGCRKADGSRKFRRSSKLSTSARERPTLTEAPVGDGVIQSGSSAFSPAAKPGSIPRRCGSSCCVVSHFHFICQHVCASVSVFPTSKATTGPRVPRQELLEGGCMQWEAQRVAHAGPSDDQRLCPRIRLGRSGSSGSKSSPTDCHCSGESI